MTRSTKQPKRNVAALSEVDSDVDMDVTEDAPATRGRNQRCVAERAILLRL